MNSVLPDSLEQKRLTIARANNRRIYSLLGGMAVAFLATILLIRGLPREQRYTMFFAIVVVVLPLEFFVIRKGWKQNDEMCRNLGFICPHCGAPLYEPRSFISVNGMCPKCHKSVVP